MFLPETHPGQASVADPQNVRHPPELDAGHEEISRKRA